MKFNIQFKALNAKRQHGPLLPEVDSFSALVGFLARSMLGWSDSFHRASSHFELSLIVSRPKETAYIRGLKLLFPRSVI